jgi:hypothetical protein
MPYCLCACIPAPLSSHTCFNFQAPQAAADAPPPPALQSKALSAPGAALGEVRQLREELFGLRRDKALAEQKEAEVRRELSAVREQVRMMGWLESGCLSALVGQVWSTSCCC